MARRRNQDKALGALLALGLIIGIPLWIIREASDAVGPLAVVAILIGLAVGFLLLRIRARAARRAQLLEKYGDENVVELIMKRSFWQGQTDQQLIDSIGRPVAIDDHLLKTKKRQTWKYNQTGVNRYKLRLTLENDVVIGWDKKA
ncbi:hypothetical protein [Granulicella sp. L46]|uniref:hypothetical protein n=1 Tax=Granulicella sp. L46 TaxID=1641865 RepID=UPI001C20474C|nr:hypothetical protein [Granulicella sp. L46]